MPHRSTEASHSAPPPDPGARRRHWTLFRAIERRRNPRLRRTDITVTDEPTVRRAVKAAALGNAMEWFDFGIYSYLALTIGKVFFPTGSATTSLLSSFATFAVAFLVRPLGGAYFGPLGDRIGRKKVLALTMIMMALGTLGIGLIPSYAAIGLWSPALLILFRLVQGFSTGGEYGGASTFIAEYAPDKKRGYFGSFLEMGTLIGYTGAAGIVLLLNTTLGPETMLAWGWRVPFLIAGPLGLVGLYLRLRLDETPAFQKLESTQTHAQTHTPADSPARTEEELSHLPAESPQKEPGPREKLGEILTQHWPALILCIALVGAYNITDYMLLSYMPTYLTDTLEYSETHGLLILLATMVVLICLLPLVGKLNDRYGRKPLLMTGMLGFALLAIPAFLLVKKGSLLAVGCGMALLGLSLLCLLGTMSAALPALFPTSVRYGSLAIGYNLAVSLFGGTTPLVITALMNAFHQNVMVPAYYTMGAALIGALAVTFMKETAQQPLEGSPPSVSTKEEALALIAARTPEPRF